VEGTPKTKYHALGNSEGPDAGSQREVTQGAGLVFWYRSVGRVFREEWFEVVSVDINPKFNPTMIADFLE
jgi:hypothetical protein